MVIKLERVHALCFDVDGTLSDTDDILVCRLARWLTPLQILLAGKDPLASARRIVMATESPGNKVMGWFDRLGIDDELNRTGDFLYRIGLGRSSKPFLLISGVQQMLETLYPRYPMSIVSARGRSSTFRFLEQFQLTNYFQSIATAQTCEHTKPYPDPILWAADQMRVPVENCLMIGDTTVDIQAGKAAGAQTVGVLCGFGQKDELRLAGADSIIPETPHLAEILLNSTY